MTQHYNIKDLTAKIIGCAFKVHSALGPGLLESSYTECLHYELQRTGLFCEKEKPLPLVYEQIKLEIGYRVDILVEKKAAEAFNDVHIAQVLTYLKLSGCKVGLLLNFCVADMKKGIRRLIL